jgi:hypothetical protein
MKLEWVDFTLNPQKYPQDNPRDVIVCGAKGSKYTYGVHRKPRTRLIWLTVQIGPIMIRETVARTVDAAKRRAQDMEDGKVR